VNAYEPNPPMDPWEPGVSAADVPVAEGGGPNPLDANKADELEPDREALSRFASIMFKHARRDGVVSLRLFPDKGSQQDKPIDIEPIRIGDPDFLDIAVIRAAQAATWHEPAVFCPPVATFKNHQNAKADNICEGIALSVECDQLPQQARQTLEAILGAPTVAVESGGEWTNPNTGEVEPKVHLHWRLKKPTATPDEHAVLKEARRLATELVGGDGTNISIVHPIRWPGSWHRKKEPRIAKITASSENEIDLTKALDLLRDAAGALDFNQAKVKASSKFRAADDTYVASALSVIANGTDPKEHDWDYWNRIGMATWAATGGSEAGGKAFAEWSAKSSKNDPVVTENRWQHYKTSPPTDIGFGSLVYLARKHSPGWSYGEAVDPVEPVDLWAKFDPPTLPRGVLPEVIEAFAFDRGMAMGCDMAGLAASALAVCAAAIPDGIKLQPKKHDIYWLESARLWFAPVGSPSTMKTPMMDAAVKPLRRIDAEMAKANHLAMADYNKLSAEERKKTEAPKQTRLMMQDTTIEAAQEILKDSPDGVLSYQDELSGWFGAMDKYSGGKGAAKDRAFWLQSFNGGSYSTNRIGRGSVFIENLSVSMLGGIQPEPIKALADDGADDGLLQRLIPIVLGSAVVGRDEKPGDAVYDYNKLVSNLHNLEPAAGSVLTFDDGALAIRVGLEKKHLELQQCETINRKLASHIGKYNGIFARLCVVWHCVEHATGTIPGTITEATARRAAGFLHAFLLPHALAFYAGVLGLSNDHDALTAIAGYILAHKPERITYRDCMRGDSVMKRLKPRDAEVLFEQLHGLGWVTRTPGPRPSTPTHWIVNPAVHERFAERGKAEAERRERDRATIAEITRGARS
jgi:hypothetical protein